MDWLLKHHEEIRNLGLVFAAGIALPLAIWRSYIAHRQTRIAENNHLADTYTKAIDQLGKEENEIRLGGLYALEKIAQNNRRYHAQIMEVLCAFVRLHAPLSISEEDKANFKFASKMVVQAALTIIGRRNSDFDVLPMNKLIGFFVKLLNLNLDKNSTLNKVFKNILTLLSKKVDTTDLNNNRLKLNLSGTNLSGMNLFRANLTYTNLYQANLSNTTLGQANLSYAHISSANLSNTHTFYADFTHAFLIGVNFANAILSNANLSGSRLSGAILLHTILSDTNVTLEQLQSARVFKSTDLPRTIDKTKLTFEELPE